MNLPEVNHAIVQIDQEIQQKRLTMNLALQQNLSNKHIDPVPVEAIAENQTIIDSTTTTLEKLSAKRTQLYGERDRLSRQIKKRPFYAVTGDQPAANVIVRLPPDLQIFKLADDAVLADADLKTVLSSQVRQLVLTLEPGGLVYCERSEAPSLIWSISASSVSRSSNRRFISVDATNYVPVGGTVGIYTYPDERESLFDLEISNVATQLRRMIAQPLPNTYRLLFISFVHWPEELAKELLPLIEEARNLGWSVVVGEAVNRRDSRENPRGYIYADLLGINYIVR